MRSNFEVKHDARNATMTDNSAKSTPTMHD